MPRILEGGTVGGYVGVGMGVGEGVAVGFGLCVGVACAVVAPWFAQPASKIPARTAMINEVPILLLRLIWTFIILHNSNVCYFQFFLIKHKPICQYKIH